jgi:hypothetical protein
MESSAVVAMLTPDERDTLIDLLIAASQAQAAPRGFLVAWIPNEVQSELDANGTPDALSKKTIEICIRSQYQLAPPALAVLLENLINFGHPELAPLRNRILHPPPAPVSRDPFDAMILSNRLPFMDRGSLRSILRSMCSPNFRIPILAISGDVESGRSHSAELVAHYCFEDASRAFCKIALTDANASATGPLQVARDLVTQLGGVAPAPPVMTNKEAWYKDLADWVVTSANLPENGARRRAWIVLDGFDNPGLREDTFAFLVELMGLFTVGLAARQHRLVFCGAPDALVVKLPHHVHPYVTDPVPETHVRAIVTEIVAAQAKIPAAERPTVVDQTMQIMLQGQALPLVSLKAVGERLGQAIIRAGI